MAEEQGAPDDLVPVTFRVQRRVRDAAHARANAKGTTLSRKLADALHDYAEPVLKQL